MLIKKLMIDVCCPHFLYLWHVVIKLLFHQRSLQSIIEVGDGSSAVAWPLFLQLTQQLVWHVSHLLYSSLVSLSCDVSAASLSLICCSLASLSCGSKGILSADSLELDSCTVKKSKASYIAEPIRHTGAISTLVAILDFVLHVVNANVFMRPLGRVGIYCALVYNLYRVLLLHYSNR